MNEKKLQGMMGFALKTRQAATGADACSMMIQSGKCGILLLDEEAGVNTRERFEKLCRRTGTRIAILPAGLLETATGCTGVTMALRKGPFADQIAGCL